MDHIGAGVTATVSPSEKGTVPSKVISHAISLIKTFELDARSIFTPANV